MAATAVGLRNEELHVEGVAVRILPQPTAPHGVAATFDLVRERRGEEVARSPVRCRCASRSCLRSLATWASASRWACDLVPPGRPHRDERAGGWIPLLNGGAAAVEPLGRTVGDAERFALVCLHSGVFLRSQYLASRRRRGSSSCARCRHGRCTGR